jgi:hypothetical protein
MITRFILGIILVLVCNTTLMAGAIHQGLPSFGIGLLTDNNPSEADFLYAVPSTVKLMKKRCPDILVRRTDKAIADGIGLSQDKLEVFKTLRKLTNDDICKLPEPALKKMLARFENPKPDHPGEWAKYRALQRRGSDGKVKADGLIQGLKQRRDLLPQQLTAATGTTGNTVVAPMAGTNATRWTSIGPGNIGGRIRAIAVHPTTTSIIIIGSVSGGIWKSTDSGVSWNPVNDFMGNLSISSLVFDPSNTNIIYAGTGEGFYNADAVKGNGVFKSTDGGATWNSLTSTTPSTDINTAAYSWFYVNRLAISSSGTLLAASGGYYGNYGNIWRSTDGGGTWSSRYSNRVLDVRFDPNNSNNALASAIGYNFTSSWWESYIVRSTDGGQSWTPVKTFTNSSGRIELAYTKANSQIVYASRNNANGEIWKSADGGATWGAAPVSNPAHFNGQGWYDNTIWVDPTDATHVVIGGIDLYRSTNSGGTWTKISDWVANMYGGLPSIPHADHHIIASDPGYDGSSNRKVYFGNDGGIFRAVDITAATTTTGWENLNNNLSITQFYGAAGSSATNRVYGGTQDNGSLFQPDTGISWTHIYGGDGGYSAVDSTGLYLFGEYVYLQLHRNTNGGATELSASSIYSGISDSGSSSTANFIAPFVLDPNNNNTLLAGGNSLWRSTNVKAATPTWSAIKIPSTKLISAISIQEGDSNHIWVGHNDGTLFKTVTGTASPPIWNSVTGGVPSGATGRMVNRVLIDKSTPNTVYVAYGGYANNNLYKSTDGGLTWSNIHGTIPAVPIFSITRHPTNATWLYAGTEVGLFTSMDGGTTWGTINDGPANVEISELFWLNSTTLVAATHGRGIFKSTITSSDPNPPVATNDSYSTAKNSTLNVSAPGVLFNDTDVQGGLLVAKLVTGPAHAQTFTLYPNGSFTYIPVTGYTGTDSFTYRANDGINDSTLAATVTIRTGFPEAPTIASAKFGNTQATMSFSAPASDGGSVITGYTVMSSPGGGIDSNTGTTGLSHTVTNLTNGVPYTFTVTATNAVGPGNPSTPSSSVTPGVVHISGFDTLGYQTLQTGYNETPNMAEIQLTGGGSVGALTVTQLGTVTIKGGFDSAFLTSGGAATILGKVTLQAGTTKFQNVVIK